MSEVNELIRRQPLNNIPAKGEVPGEKSSGVEVFDSVEDEVRDDSLANSDNPFKPK